MKITSKISIIIPIFNTEAYLSRCLDSIINQTYGNLEIILVNDGSTDSSGVICKKYKENDKRIKIVEQENSGQGAARNAGLKEATGELIVFVDSDDYVALDLCQTINSFFSKYSIDIVIYNLEAGEQGDYQFLREEKPPVYMTGIDYLRGMYSVKNFDSSVLKAYRSRLFDDIIFPAGRTMGEDVGTIYKLIYKADQIVLLDQKLYYYFQSPNSTVRGNFTIQKSQECYSFKERLLFFKSIDEDDLYARALLQYEVVILRSIYYIQNQYTEEQNRTEELYIELLFVKQEIWDNSKINPVKKILYQMATLLPVTAGWIISRVL